MADAEVTLRRAVSSDAAAIARILHNALTSLDRMPKPHTAEADLSFIRETVLARRAVTVAQADAGIVGFMAVREAWIDLLYVDPAWTGRGIGSRLLAVADRTMAGRAGIVETKLYCFRSNVRACRFYERHGFRAQAFCNGSDSGGRVPDVLYVRSRPQAALSLA